MDPLIQTALIGGGLTAWPLLLGRWNARWAVALCAALVGVYYAVRVDALDPSALLHSAAPRKVALVLLWAILLQGTWRLLVKTRGRAGSGHSVGSFADAAASRLSLGGCVVATSVLIGDVAATILWVSPQLDSRQNARIALTASAAGLLSPLGTASTLLLPDRLSRVPLALILLVFCWPRGARSPQTQASLPSFLRAMVWLVGVGVVCCLADAFGSLSLAREALGWLATRLPYELSGVWALLGSFLAAVGGEEAAALVASCVLGDGQGTGIASVTLALGSGMAVGGLGPLLVSGCLRAGWRLWLFQVALAAAWAVCACSWRFP